ncbi:Cof-type HAD-IIB family hydrolase [Anaerolentibacter hominis]|uniref:Cof-type HAD-IIB family hydrolase n=1 Tax=Anaerolentibacter hominis TaxID=3079009 RepID=UPI0031B82195
MAEIKMIALDLDGTLYTDDKKISDRNLAALKRAVEKGIYVVPTTGRVYRRLSKELYRIEGLKYVVMTNGASIMDMDTREYIYRDLMPMTKVRQLLKEFEQFDLMPEANVDGYVIVEDQFYSREKLLEYGIPEGYLEAVMESNVPTSSLKEYFKDKDYKVEKINVMFRTLEERQRAKDYFDRDPDLKVTSSLKYNLEINMKTATKASGLEHLAQLLGFTRENVMACGDGLNDVDMIQYAGLGVAMANALDVVKENADYITLTNMEDGVAAAVEKFCL